MFFMVGDRGYGPYSTRVVSPSFFCSKLAMRFWVLLFLWPAIHLQAGPQTPPNPFQKGRLELQSASGAYFSVGDGGRPTLNVWAASYRLGLMLDDPAHHGLWRGNWEPLLQFFSGRVFDGPGNAFGGAGLLMRYNSISKNGRWIPYLQAGAGILFNDIYKERSQRLIGQAWEFDLEAALGVRYMLGTRWSLGAEAGFRHISNANLSERNVGLNSLGALLCLGFHF